MEATNTIAIITAITAIITVIALFIGLYLNFRQLRKANAQRRGDIVSDALWKIYDDQELKDIFYKIEYGKLEYNNDFHDSENEQKLDKLITVFDIVAKKYYLGLVNIKDVGLINYEYLAVCQDENVKKYLEYLNNRTQDLGLKERPFNQFIKLSKLVEKEYLAK